ncbi:hypothetical protein AB833_23540 [Chromatiales bacterium (ex Bugula neritina AB1)]|nr:hypothetical protein AB833_23540 [Chromatiales bacterium (ex Bugula neritina AB1)]
MFFYVFSFAYLSADGAEADEGGRLTRIIHGVARISRRPDLFTPMDFTVDFLLALNTTDICKRKNSLWNQRSGEIPSIP